MIALIFGRMAVDSVLVHCAACEATLEENPRAPFKQRVPCSGCGSLSRLYDVNISATLTFHSKLTAKARYSGEKRPFVEQTVGDDLHRKGGRWMRLHRLIDRMNDWYHERVTDSAAGRLMHECSEALTKHRGHGSAKPKAQE